MRRPLSAGARPPQQAPRKAQADVWKSRSASARAMASRFLPWLGRPVDLLPEAVSLAGSLASETIGIHGRELFHSKD